MVSMNWFTINLDNGVSPVQRQAIISNDELSLISYKWTDINENYI